MQGLAQEGPRAAGDTWMEIFGAWLRGAGTVGSDHEPGWAVLTLGWQGHGCVGVVTRACWWHSSCVPRVPGKLRYHLPMAGMLVLFHVCELVHVKH